MSNPYAPDETTAQIYAEETWLQGALLSNIFYGVELCLFVQCFATLIRRTNRTNFKGQLCMLTFTTVIFILGSFFMGSIDKFTQLAFIENRNFPGGPGAYEEAMFWIPIDELGNVAFVIGNWLMDLLLVWRCKVIYEEATPSLRAIMAFPWLMLLASVALGTVFLVQTSTSSPFSAVNFTLAYFVMTLALNIIVTILIALRLIYLRRHVGKTVDASRVLHYTNVAAILIESASMYSAFAILFLVPFGLNNALSQVFLQTMSQVQTVSSLLIILRLASGNGWTDGTTTRIMANADVNAHGNERSTGSPFSTESMEEKIPHAMKGSGEHYV